MALIIGPPTTAIRCRPITNRLRGLLDAAAMATGIDKIVIVSGGQPSNHAASLKNVVCGWTGSRRHDNGGAADIELVKNGVTLRFSDTDGSQVAAFVTACAARGANGIGAGVNYMGPKRLHVGFGNSPSDMQNVVWGEDGASANAPDWLRVAANQGWNNPVGGFQLASPESPTISRSVVVARDGLWLRKGPGLDFDRSRLLDAGTPLAIMGMDGDWARVDLQGDGQIDGHVLSAFLRTIRPDDGDNTEDGIEEPIDDTVAERLLAEHIGAGSSDDNDGAPQTSLRRRAK